MVLFPNCKINIGLTITGKRDDGYHNMETIFYPLAIKDAVEIIEHKDAEKDIVFSITGKEIAGNEQDNLCIKAYRLLRQDFPKLPPVKIHLHKHIPMGAGLGGGSADASAILILLNKKFSLNISKEKLLHYALQLGSDCPFFIVNKPSFATGRGEVLQPIKLNLSAYKIVLVNPRIHINTKAAFAHLNPEKFSKVSQLLNDIQKDIFEWKKYIKNDFETPVFTQHPEIENIKKMFYDIGAAYSAMSGSGSSVYGIFKKDDIINIKLPSHYFCQFI